MRRHDLLARRDLLKSAAALSAGMALQRAHLVGAQDASPTAEPQEVTATAARSRASSTSPGGRTTTQPSSPPTSR